MSSLISFAYFLVFECKIDSNLVAAKYYVGFRFMNMTSFKDVFKVGIKWERILSYIKTVNTCTRQKEKQGSFRQSRFSVLVLETFD